LSINSFDKVVGLENPTATDRVLPIPTLGYADLGLANLSMVDLACTGADMDIFLQSIDMFNICCANICAIQS
jgi:hypothetical protein